MKVVDSPKKWTNEFIFVFLPFYSSRQKKTKFVHSVFGRIYNAQICLRFYLTFRWTKYLSNLRLQKCIYSSKKARSDISNSQAHWGWPKLSCRFDGRGMPLAIMICLGKFSKRAVCLELWLYLLIFVFFYYFAVFWRGRWAYER